MDVLQARNPNNQMQSVKNMKQNQTLYPAIGTPKVGKDLGSTTYIMLIGQFCK